MKKHLSTFLLALALVLGLFLLLYPTVSEQWNKKHQTQAIVSYTEAVSVLNKDSYDEIWQAAYDYNASLLQRKNRYLLSAEQKERYEKLLDIGGNGIMGYVEIPAIDVALPLYHGTEESVLQIAAGHLEWTSLPVGGEGSHCVLSGHRGLPSARLFSDLDELVVGDVFMLRVLDEVLSYEVDKIMIVKPEDTGELFIKEGEDLCTLVTCTPYGINSHRILVRGHRIENRTEAEQVLITADAERIDPNLVAPMLAAPMLLLVYAFMLLPRRGRNRRSYEAEE